MAGKDKNKNKYQLMESSDFGVGAVRFGSSNGGGSGNTGSCGIQISCVLCCCIGSGGGAENLKAHPKV